MRRDFEEELEADLDSPLLCVNIEDLHSKELHDTSDSFAQAVIGLMNPSSSSQPLAQGMGRGGLILTGF